MKRNKAINVTKRDIRSAIVEDRNYCYNYVSGNGRTRIKRTSLGYNYNSFKKLDLQNVSNWSHLTCSCQDSVGKCQETSYFTTKVNQMQPKGVTDIGVGNVKTYQRRKAKRISLPQTEERAVGTSNIDYPKFHHSNRYNEFSHKITRNCGERAADRNKKYLLDKKLSPLIRTKSNYTNPLNTFFRIQEMNNNVNNTLSLHNRFNVTTQVCAKELAKSPKIKIFKELATNTDFFENVKAQKSEVELPVEMSKILNNKNGNGSSLDSLVQHVYNLDKPCNATLSTTTIDPMENKLEREYRKIFSNQSRDCACNNKISVANSDSLLRRFEALRRDLSLKDESNKNLSKTSSRVNGPSHKDVSIDSDRPSLQMPGNNKRIVSTLSNEFSDTHPKEKSKIEKKKFSSNTKLQKSSHWRRSDVDSDHQGTKGRFKLWGKKISVEDGSHKKSKIKCSDVNKKSEGSMKLGKLLKNKSSVKKEGKKFHFFKKKMKVASKILRSKTDVMTGRCEVHERMAVRIGKGLLRQECNTKTIKKLRLKYEDKLLNVWIKNFLTKSDASRKNLSMKYSSSMNSNYSSSSSVGGNSSSETDMQLTTTTTVTNNSSLRVNKSPFINFSNQYIQAWMLTKTILDRLVNPKVYWNVKTEKYNKKKNIEFRSKYFDYKETKPKNKVSSNNNTYIKDIIKPKPKRPMVDICLGCMSGFSHQSYAKQSNEEVYNIIDYETPQQSSANFLRQNFEKEKCNDIISKTRMKDITNCRFNDTEDFKKIKRSYSADIFQENELDAPNKCNAVGVGIAQNDRELNYPVYELGSTESGDDLEESVYILPKTNKYSEMYLRKFYHNWNPLDLDLWCISDTNLQPSFNTNYKDANFKSYSNMTDDIHFTTLVSSCETFANSGKGKHKKSLLKNHNFDFMSTNIGIRISPKDSLEVLKKRKLYTDSNKGKWKHDNELSVSLSGSTKSKSHFKKFISLKPNKKRVTISSYEVDKESNPKQKEKDLRKKKNLQCLSSSLHVSDSLHTGRKLPSKLERKPTLQNVSITAATSSLFENTSNNVLSYPPNSDVKCLKSASKDQLLNVTESCITNWKKQLCGENSTNDARVKKTSEKMNETKSGFFSDYFKPSSLIKNKYHSIYRKFVTDKKSSDEFVKKDKTEVKKCAITTDVQKLSALPNSVEDKSSSAPVTDPEINKNKGKLVGLHFKKQPIRRNVSRACWTAGDRMDCTTGNSTDNTTKASSKENTGITYKVPHSTSTVSKVTNKELNNLIVNKDNDDNENKDVTSVIEKKIVTQPNVVSTSESEKKICLDEETSKNQVKVKSECDFIEIVFKIRCKHGDDRAMIVNINDSHDRIKKENKVKISEKGSDVNNKNKEVYLVQNESGTSTVHKNSKNCMNVKILIKNCKNDDLYNRQDLKGNNHNNSPSTNSKKISEKYRNISSESIKAINNYPYSVHKFTIDLTKSVKNVKSSNTSNENIGLFESNNKGTVTSDSDFQKNVIINNTETNDSRSNRNIICHNNSITNNNRKSKLHTSKTKNERLYYSSATLRPYRRYSFTKQMSNYKQLKNKVIQKIVECAKDFNKSKRKEKQIKKVSSAMRSLDYSDRHFNNEQNVKKFSRELGASTLYSHFLNATNSSYGYCHFDSMVREKPKRNVNNYLFTVVTEADKHRKLDSPFNSVEYGKKKTHSTKILATKLGLTDLRSQVCQSTRNGENYYYRTENIKTMSQDKNERLDFMYDLSSYDIGRCCKFSSFVRHNYADTTTLHTDHRASQNIITRKSKLDNNAINVSKLRINRLNKGVVCVSDERNITIVSSKFVEEKCISCHMTGLEETCNHCRKEKVDIFQLTEIKRAVFEMYNTTEISNKSKLLVKLPKFESDVENLLIM